MEHDRRDEELQGVKERLFAVEREQEQLQKLVSGMNYALFGLPEDRTNNGLVGTMADFRNEMHKLSGTINRALVATLSAIAAGVIADILARTIGG